MKKIKGFLIILLLLVVVVFVIMAITRVRNEVCETLIVKVDATGENEVFTERDVDSLLRVAGVHPVGKIHQSIRRQQLIDALSAHVWFDEIRTLTRSGKDLILEVSVRKPIVRVFPIQGDAYLLDEEGGMLPDSEGAYERLPVMSGQIKAKYKAGETIYTIQDPAMISTFEIVTAVMKDKVLAAQFPQFEVRSNGETDMYSVLGNHIVHVGTSYGIAEKLKNLHLLYSEALVYMYPDSYSQIDVRFKNKVFATKK